jgi:hypothetical protein
MKYNGFHRSATIHALARKTGPVFTRIVRQGGNLHHEKPPERCDTRRNFYETGARGWQRDIVQAS